MANHMLQYDVNFFLYMDKTVPATYDGGLEAGGDSLSKLSSKILGLRFSGLCSANFILVLAYSLYEYFRLNSYIAL